MIPLKPPEAISISIITKMAGMESKDLKVCSVGDSASHMDTGGLDPGKPSARTQRGLWNRRQQAARQDSQAQTQQDMAWQKGQHNGRYRRNDAEPYGLLRAGLAGWRKISGQAAQGAKDDQGGGNSCKRF